MQPENALTAIPTIVWSSSMIPEQQAVEGLLEEIQPVVTDKTAFGKKKYDKELK